MRLIFLGTSAGAPTRQRNVTCQALSFDDGAVWLLDCGEASQHQLMKAGIRPKMVERILITHLHGDHIYGIFGMLACLAIHGREAPVQIVGPRGVREMVTTVLRLSDFAPGFPLIFSELDRPDPGGAELPAWPIGASHPWTVTAHHLVHRLACVGYCLHEPPRPGRFHPDRARAAQVPEGPLWGNLQRGVAVTLADGRRVDAAEVCDPPRRGRKLLLLGDTSDADAMLAIGQDCDLAVREVTYDNSRQDKALLWQHSTASMTGSWAQQMRAKTLVMTHLSARYTDEDPDPVRTIASLHAEVAAACPGTRVIIADDLLSVDIPASDELAS